MSETVSEAQALEKTLPALRRTLAFTEYTLALESEDVPLLRQTIRACQDAYNELYARNVRLYDELTAAHEVIERLQRAEAPARPFF